VLPKILTSTIINHRCRKKSSLAMPILRKKNYFHACSVKSQFATSCILYSNKDVFCGRKNRPQTLHKAFEIRISYADTGIIETHDLLQQMLNLVNMLILAGDLEFARLKSVYGYLNNLYIR
jgi:hypothetical protein